MEIFIAKRMLKEYNKNDKRIIKESELLMMIVIKVNEVPNSKEGLRDRVRRAWRISQDRLYNQEELMAVYKGEILEVYKVLSYGKDQIEENRVAFELEEIPSDLKGKRIEYKTANPCTIVDVQNLKFL
ncbi:hypothetical protein FZC66_04815 [Priestia megaterium]|nr:hypothetical protein FZC66_04815 [Priestia megaterium]